MSKLVNDSTGRRLFAFSEHEQKLLHKATGLWYRRRYENVRTISERWRRTKHPRSRDNNNTLLDFASVAGITVPKDYGKGQVTENLRTVREYSQSKRRWQTAPAAVRQSWERVLAHNAFDVTAMYELLCVIEKSTLAVPYVLKHHISPS